MKKTLLKCTMIMVFMLAVSGCGKSSKNMEEMTEPTENMSETVESVDKTLVEESKNEELDKEAVESDAIDMELYAYYYDSMLCNYRGLFEGGSYDDKEPSQALLNIAEVLGTDALYSLGYAMEDLSGDGVPELLIGQMNSDFGMPQDAIIYAIYTLDKDTPVLVAQAQGSDCWYWKKDNEMIGTGSGGNIYYYFGGYQFTKDGKSLICNDFYYTHEVDGDYSNIGCYYNTTGEMDGLKSEQINMSLDDFFVEQDKYLSNAKKMNLTVFADYAGVGDASYTEHTWLNVTMQEDMTTIYDNCDSVNLTDDEWTVKIIFEGGKLKNFKVLSLQMMDVTEDGTPVFDEETAFEYGEFKEGVPLIVGLTFYGDTPSWGFSYQDEDGKTCKGYLCLSGYDGSLLVERY